MTYILSPEQLQKLMEDTARKAAEESIKNFLEATGSTLKVQEEVKDDPAAPVSAKKAIKVSEFSKEQYQEALDVMSANRGNDDQPKVGIFWYNRARHELFGVVARKTSDFTKTNARGGLVTCTEMHEDIWKKEFRKQKYHGGQGPYIGAYEDKPRGRVFYSPKDDAYIIAVGTWINENEDAIALIMEEFNLPSENTTIQVAEHWDIGQKWM